MSNKTSNKIVEAALELMSEQGYHDVSTKDIAAKAQVSEMTVFRHFHTKLGILEAVIHTYSYDSRFTQFFAEQLTSELESDLLLFSQRYVEEMTHNRSLLLIAIQERGRFPQLMELIAKHNFLNLREKLTQYFINMQSKGFVKPQQDAQQLATQLLTLLYGYCSTIILWKEHPFFLNNDSFVSDAVVNFIYGIRKQ